MLRKVLFLSCIAMFAISCSSGSDEQVNETSPAPVNAIAITGKVDNVSYNFPSPSVSNTADASGGTYGSDYFLLRGINTSGPSKTGIKTIEIKLLVPKSNITTGSHSFTTSPTTGEYFADMDISNTLPSENVNTIGGSLNVTSYNASTKEIKGSFLFTTEDGVNAGTSHTVIGNFDYYLP